MKDLHEYTILIVDDTPENIDVLTGLLSEFKRKVAVNGKKALSIVMGTSPPDLILLDIMMPEMDGFEVCKRIRADERTRDIPIIFITAKTESVDIVKGFEFGAQDYVTKPFDPNELFARVNTHLELKMSREKLKDVNLWLEDQVKQKTKELQLAYDELSTLDNAKTEFLQILSHEIRTPLNGIIGSLDLMKSEKDAESQELFKDLLDQSVKRLEKFSTTAIEITELKTQRDKLNIDKNVNFKSVLNESVSSQEKEISQGNITIDFIGFDRDYSIPGNSYYLKSCFTHIIKNAIEVSNEGDKITISVKQIENNLECVIKDQGTGFTEKGMKNLFKPFGLGKEHIEKNIGLGLHFVKLVVDSLSGEIEAGNNPDKGAFVKILFPLAK